MPRLRIAFEWDESKRRSNLEKHSVDFSDAWRLDWDKALSIDHIRDGESRTLTYAPIDDRLHAVVWTKRGAAARLISLRKANSREVTKYEKTNAANVGGEPED